MSAPKQGISADNSSSFEHWRVVLTEAVKEVFSMMVGAEVSIPEVDPSSKDADVTGMVGLAGQMCGVLSVRCSRNAAMRIASQMLGVPPAEAASHQSDAVGEICNMVAGNFKAKIDGLQDKCMLSVPTVITGEDYQLHSLASGDRVELLFVFEGEPLWTMLDVRS
jgi:chemotaxis protein CheX